MHREEHGEAMLEVEVSAAEDPQRRRNPQRRELRPEYLELAIPANEGEREREGEMGKKEEECERLRGFYL